MRRVLAAVAVAVAAFICSCSQDGKPVQAGFATARIPAPLGIGTSGHGPFDVPASSSPFAQIFPATTRMQSHPEIRVAVLAQQGGEEIVFVRVDTIGVFQQLRRAVVLELERRLGRDLDDSFIFGATHTHAGPGRVVAEGGLFDYLADTFLPEYYERLIATIADTVEEAYADLRPAKVGHVIGWAEEAHNNRRCEDGSDYKNSSVPVIAVERAGKIEGLIFSYAVHGTAIGIKELTLSRDIPGGIEHAIEERFDHPVQVLMFTSWAGDMSPGNPGIQAREGAELPRNYDRMDVVGESVADAVEEALGDLEVKERIEISSRTFRTRIDRDLLGYEGDAFPYPYGALYCNTEVECGTPMVQVDLDQQCLPFPFDQPAPDQTEFSVGRVGDLFLVTFTGEPLTTLAEYVMDGMRAHSDVGDVMFLGYTQDYLGYSLLEEEWWWGGYEAGGTLWGPRQGDFLADFVVGAFDAYIRGERLPGQPAPWSPFWIDAYDSYDPMTPIGFGELLEDVGESYGPSDVVSFTVKGGDPWLGTPTAILETADGATVTRRGGQPIDSDGYYFWVDLVPEPAYGIPADEREFRWTFNFPVSRRYALSSPVLEGSYRFKVELPREDGSVKEIRTEEFTVAR